MPGNSPVRKTITSRNLSPSHEIQVSPKWLLRTVGWVVLASAALAYLTVGCLLYFDQSRFLFETSYAVDKTPADFGADFENAAFGPPVEGKASLTGWWIPAPSPTSHTLLYLHGNAATISGNAGRAVAFDKLGLNVFLFDYRGFGNSQREFPNEQRVYEDADAAWNFLRDARRLQPRDIVIYGSSLGGSIATELARRHPDAAGLVLESTFTSIAELSRAQHRFTLMPLGLLLHQRFDSPGKVSQVRMPILIIQGGADRQVPPPMARELYNAAAGPRQLLMIPQGGHETNAQADPATYYGAFNGFLKTAFAQSK